MIAAMQRRLATILCVIVIGLGAAGCTKCGWLWQDGARTCHADVAPR